MSFRKDSIALPRRDIVTANSFANEIKQVDRIWRSSDHDEGFAPAGRNPRQDGWINALVGLSKGQDKSQATQFGNFTFMDRNQLSRMYVGDGLGRKIVDAKADDMTREWITFEMDNPDEELSMEHAMQHIKAPQYFNEALKWARCFGGSVIVVGAMDGQYLDQPLNLDKCNSIEWLKVVDMWDIDLPSSVWERDPQSPQYGQIVQYLCQFRVSGTGRVDRILVHESRILPFYGENVPKSLVMGDQRTRYWGASVLQAIWENVGNVAGAFQIIYNIIYEFTIGKYIIPNLQDLLAQGQEAALSQRMELISMSKSVINAVLLGEGEDYKRDSASVAGLADLVDRIMMLLAGMSNYPVTRLFGRSAAGMNSTGEGDENMYYDDCASKQRIQLEPPLEKLCLMMAKVMKMKSIPKFEFAAMKQSTDKETAEVTSLEAKAELEQAQADTLYWQMNALTPEEIAAKRNFTPEAKPSSIGVKNVNEAILNKEPATPGSPISPGQNPGTQVM